jgi:cyclopropane fatty-acyl-phospholipid synthase-like methyltransferase
MARRAAPSDPTGYHDWFSHSYVDTWIDQDAAEGSRRGELDALVAKLELPRDEASRVLDVGGGWGPVTRCLLDQYPMTTVVLHDFSGPMLERARAHLAGDLKRVRFHQADLRDPKWLDDVGESFDGVVSSLAIHNVRDDVVIERVYRDLFAAMRPGSILADLDLLEDHSIGERRSWLEGAGFASVTVDADAGAFGAALFRARRP